jgi:transcriptional regulator with XRE-family HTH domain
MDLQGQLVGILQAYGESYRDLEKRTGVDQATIFRFMKSERTPSWRTVYLIASGLGLEITLKRKK